MKTTHHSTQSDLNAMRATQAGAWDLPMRRSLSELAEGNRQDRRRAAAINRKANKKGG